MSNHKRIIEVLSPPQPHWVGDGFPVRSMFSIHAQDPELISPFLLLDYAGPVEFPPSETGKPRGVDQHPHRGFETVTIVYRGELEHRDSSGNRGRIGPGDVQWMTAGSGVVHEEKHSSKFTRDGGTFEVVQLWVNLPASAKMSSPRYQELSRATIPTVPLPADAGQVRVIAGECQGTRGPATTVTAMNVYDIRLAADSHTSLELSESASAILFLLRGSVTINGKQVGEHECAILSRDNRIVELRADLDATILLLSGEPIDEPVVAHGPFVMNTRAEIKEAVNDYQQGRMGRLPALTPP